MSRRNCLLITSAFPPAGGAGVVRVVRLTEQLMQQGWRVDVIAPRGAPGFFEDRSLEEVVPEHSVHRVGLPSLSGLTRTLRQSSRSAEPGAVRDVVRGSATVLRELRDRFLVPDELAAWIPSALLEARRLTRAVQYDLVWTSSFPYSAHVVGTGLKRLTGLPWWMDLRDPWAEHPLWRAPSVVTRRLNTRLERAAFEAADVVTVVSPGMRHMLNDRYAPALCAKVHVLENGFSPAPVPGPPRQLGDDRPLRLVYVGSFDRRLTPPDRILRLLEAVGRRAPGRLNFVHVGGADLACAEMIESFLGGMPAGQLTYERQGFVAHAEALRQMQEADAVVLSMSDSASWVYCAKLFEYLGSGRPIVALVPEGDAATLLDKTGGALICRPGEEAALVDELVQATTSGELPIPPRDAEVIDAFSWQRLGERLSLLLASAVREDA